MRLLAAVLSIGLLSGCASAIKIKGEVQEVQVPILYCPAPPEFLRPDLEINNLTASELRSDGRVSQAYVATVLQLLGYTKELEDALNFYKDANVAYDDLEQRLRTAIQQPPEEQAE